MGLKIRQPLEFYIKWTACSLALAHVYLIAHDITPYYKYTGLITAGLWVWLSVLWGEPSMIILNTIMILLYIKGLLQL
jgi:hypothetical protein